MNIQNADIRDRFQLACNETDTVSTGRTYFLSNQWYGVGMLPPRFTDPLGRALPALEQNILKLRAMQMLLVLFYAEELKRKVVDIIQATDRSVTRPNASGAKAERVPKGTKNPVKKALIAFVSDKAITEEEQIQIQALIDYRNIIGHEMHKLMADLSPERTARQMVEYMPHRLPKYDYQAVDRLRHFHDRFDNLYKTHAYVFIATSNAILFHSAERTFLAEIGRLKRKITRLTEVRRKKIQNLNSELSEWRSFTDKMDPRHPQNFHKNGRLTLQGVEICYRLFDLGKTAMAVAHLLGLSLVAARKRQRKWKTLGGCSRLIVNLPAPSTER